MNNKPNWLKVYESEEVFTESYGGGGRLFKFKTSSLRLPKLITRIWTTRMIGEEPTIKENNTEIDNAEILTNIETAVNDLFAFGTTFIVPFLDYRNEYSYKSIPIQNINKYFAKDGNLEYLEYTETQQVMENGTIRNVAVKSIHNLVNNSYFFKQFYESANGIVYVNRNTGEQPITSGYMLPTIVELNVNEDSIGEPIYINATGLICDADKVYHEMINTMDLLRPIVAVPQSLTDDTPRDENGNEIVVLSGTSRLFSKIQGVTEGENKIDYFGGNFNPEPYIKALNLVLNEISKQVGLGHRYLTFDKETGIRTATEVIANQSDLFINQLLLNQSIERLIKAIAKGYLALTQNKYRNVDPTNVISVEFKDSVFNSEIEYREQLRKDVLTGIISNEFYLKETYKVEDVSEMIGVGNESI